MLDKQGYMRVHAHTLGHTQINNIYCFSTATMIRERASVLRYTYIACIVTPDNDLRGLKRVVNKH